MKKFPTPVIIAAVALMAALLIGTGAYMMFGQGDSAPSQQQATATNTETRASTPDTGASSIATLSEGSGSDAGPETDTSGDTGNGTSGTAQAETGAEAGAGSTAPSGGSPATTGLANQGVVRSQHGDWQMSCDTPPGASFEQCAIIQNVTAEDQPNVGLSVIVLKTADQQARLLRVLAPLGVLLTGASPEGQPVGGLGLNVDGTDLGRVAFVRCLPNGCVAEVIMDDELLETLSNGEQAIFVVFRTPEEGIGIPVSLNGFGEGFEALP